MPIFTFTNAAVLVLSVYLYTTISNIHHVVDPLRDVPQAALLDRADHIHPLWQQGQRFSLALFLSSNNGFAPFKLTDLQKSSQLLLYKSNLVFDRDTIDSISLDIKILESEFDAQSSAHGTVEPAAGTEHVDIVAPAAIWSLLRTNQTNVFLHVALLQAVEDGGVVEAEAGMGDGERTGSDEAAAKQINSNNFSGHDEITQNLIKSGSVLYDCVQLVKYDVVPRAFRKKFLLPDAVEKWERESGNSTWGKLFSYTVGGSGGAPLRTLFQQLTPDEKERATYLPSTIISYWKPQVSVRMVTDWSIWPIQHVPYAILKNVVEYRYRPGKPESLRADKISQNIVQRSYRYYPSVSADEIGLTSDQYIPLNKSVSNGVLPLKLSFSEQSLQQWLFLSAIQSGMEANKAALGVSDSDLDDVRRLISGTSLRLLLITFSASALHLFFEALAFHSDIEFWRNNKSLAGLSTRSVLTELISQVIIFLFLLDSDTSTLVVVPAALGILIQMWKVWKATGMLLAIRGMIPRFMQFYRLGDKIEFSEHALEQPLNAAEAREEKVREASAEKILMVTREADRIATTHLTLALVPLVVGFSMRSLLLDKHYSWASWFIGSLTACVYAFGFVLMCPQLYINHKLQSVSHLPWKFLVCRFFTTFIDDLFAFIIKMPTMHRLSVFRDDIVFLVYIWQRWRYKVDVSRPVER